jgi:hypothetical protein
VTQALETLVRQLQGRLLPREGTTPNGSVSALAGTLCAMRDPGTGTGRLWVKEFDAVAGDTTQGWVGK